MEKENLISEKDDKNKENEINYKRQIDLLNEEISEKVKEVKILKMENEEKQKLIQNLKEEVINSPRKFFSTLKLNLINSNYNF